MIRYRTSGYCHVLSVFGLTGSVIPSAFLWALGSGLLSLLVFHYLKGYGRSEDEADIRMLTLTSSSSFFTVLGFLLIFRAQMAYARYWEGVTLMQRARGSWFNAVSCLFAFSTTNPERTNEVQAFQNLMVRLMSLLYSSALQQICTMESKDFETIDLAGIDTESLMYLANMPEKCEIILQWIQRLVADAVASGVQSVPAPIMTRVFQELSMGIVNVNDARKLSEIPFPFPFAQMCTFMLLFYSMVAPLMCGWYMTRADWAFIIPAFSVSFFWTIHYTAEEIEMPFRDAPNGLNVHDFQQSMNSSLLTLLRSETQTPPTLVLPHLARGETEDSEMEDEGLQLSRLKTTCTTVNWKDLKRIDSVDSDESNGSKSDTGEATDEAGSDNRQSKRLSGASDKQLAPIRRLSSTKEDTDAFYPRRIGVPMAEDMSDEIRNLANRIERHLANIAADIGRLPVSLSRASIGDSKRPSAKTPDISSQEPSELKAIAHAQV